VRRTVAQSLRTLDGWLPVRGMRMTWTVAAACAGYMALIALQLTLIASPYERAAAAPPAPAHRGLLSISKEAGVCLLPVCLLAPTCVAGVGATCLLPLATPAPAPPVQPGPSAPVVAAPPPAAPPRPHPVSAASAPVPRAVHHVVAAPTAPAPEAPPVSLAVTPVDRPVPAAAAPSAPVPMTGVPLPPPAVALPATATPTPSGSPWWLYVLFVAVDGAAAAALVVLIRRTAATQSRG
jgi:hypothetical protein